MKEARLKRHILNYTISKKLWKSQNYRKRKWVSGLRAREWEEGLNAKEAQEGSLWGDETLARLDFGGSYMTMHLSELKRTIYQNG